MPTISATLTNDCKYISYTVQGADGTASVDITVGTVTHTTSVVLSGGTGSMVVPTSNFTTSNGVYQLKLQDSAGDVAYAAALGHCDLDCCLAKKTNELLECSCSCDKCSTILAQAHRIFLLIKAAETAVAQVGSDVTKNQGLIIDAESKYSKALELCGSSCGCNC